MENNYPYYAMFTLHSIAKHIFCNIKINCLFNLNPTIRDFVYCLNKGITFTAISHLRRFTVSFWRFLKTDTVTTHVHLTFVVLPLLKSGNSQSLVTIINVSIDHCESKQTFVQNRLFTENILVFA